ncbi:MAG: hypothetical protein ABEK50_13400 [bacterium]
MKQWVLPMFGALIFPVLFCFSPEPAEARSLDFRKLEQHSIRNHDTTGISLSEPVRIWTSTRRLNFLETGQLHGELLWAVTDDHTILLNRGRSPSAVTSGITKTMDGTIVSMDLHPLPKQLEAVLLSVVHKYSNQLLSTLYYVRYSEGELSLDRYRQIPLKAVRPVGGFLYQQRYDPARLWYSNVNRLRTSTGEFSVAQTVSAPENSRLLSMTALGNRRFVTLDKNGNLRLLEEGVILDNVDGDFGHSPLAVYPRGDRVQPEPVRIPPAWLPKRKLVVTVNNPDQTGGIQNWVFSGPNQTRLRVFRLQNKELRPVASTEFYPGIITDLEVSTFNSDQVIWIRRSDNSTFFEVLDFSR